MVHGRSRADVVSIFISLLFIVEGRQLWTGVQSYLGSSYSWGQEEVDKVVKVFKGNPTAGYGEWIGYFEDSNWG